MGSDIFQVESEFYLPYQGWRETTRICECLRDQGWKITQDQEGNIVGVFLERQKLNYNELESLNSIAEHVKDGSYIQICGEEGDIWRWVFEGGECRKVPARLVFE